MINLNLKNLENGYRTHLVATLPTLLGANGAFENNLRGNQHGGSHVNRWTWITFKKNTKKFNCSSTTFTTVFRIRLYTRCFDSSVCPHKLFWWHFVDSSKLLKNHLIAANLNEVKSSSLTKCFFKSLEESTKCCQKSLCGHTDESKHLVYRHILKTVVKVVEEKFKFLCFSSLPAIRRADPPWIYSFPGVDARGNVGWQLSRSVWIDLKSENLKPFGWHRHPSAHA